MLLGFHHYYLLIISALNQFIVRMLIILVYLISSHIESEAADIEQKAFPFRHQFIHGGER